MPEVRPNYEIVLLGIGHTNAHVLRMWRKYPIPKTRLTCVSNYPVAAYSGMLPAVLAEQVPPERMEVDLVRYAAAADARLIVSEVDGIDLQRRELSFRDHASVPFDVLSVGVGSVPSPPAYSAGDLIVMIKPMQTFLQRLDDRLHSLQSSIVERRLRVAIVGGGIAGVEVACCISERLTKRFGADRFELAILQGGDRLAPNTREKTQRIMRHELDARGIQVRLSSRITGSSERELHFPGGQTVPVDLVLWTTGAAAPPLLARLDGLDKNHLGFLRTRPTLQVVSDHPVFAVGDTGEIDGMDVPKAGVFAVRQGPVLWENLHRQLSGKVLVPFSPQSGFLKLMNLGDGRAIGEYKRLSFCGRFASLWKRAIDERFMNQFKCD